MVRARSSRTTPMPPAPDVFLPLPGLAIFFWSCCSSCKFPLSTMENGSPLFPYRQVTTFQRGKSSGWNKDQQNPRCGKRSEEHTSELQSRGHLVCRLLLEKKNN